MLSISRRRFIKTVVGTGAVITAFPQILLRKAQAAWSRGTVVHPNVDNLRVVGITDNKMTKSQDEVSGTSLRVEGKRRACERGDSLGEHR
jgi:hypothetical protein